MKSSVKLQVPFIDFKNQYASIRGPVQAAVKRVFDSQQFILKEEVAALEKEVARKAGVTHAVGVASGSDALYLALVALGIGPGDEVITVPFTFFATAGAIHRTGAKIVFVDIKPKTFNIDPSLLEARITPRTKAILPVHLFGVPCDMDAVRKIAARYGLKVIEDAAQSFGAEYKGKQTGSLSDAGCLSFFPTKNLGGAGDGGMVLTSSGELADKIRVLRVHGSRQKYYHDVVGINSRLDEIQAAVVRVKLEVLDRWNAARRKCAAEYDRALKGLPLETPFVPSDVKPIYHLYSILTEPREELAAFLERQGVGSGVYYPRCLHLQACFKELGYKKGDFPISERVSDRVLSLPLYPELSASQRALTVRSVRKFFEGGGTP